MVAKILLPISIVILLISACEPKTVSYEKATKWYSGCNPHLSYHPGDWYAVEDECHKECMENWVYMCATPCVELGYPIAEHVEGGYYSDGSYYATCENVFENIHPTRDKYEKTQWQKDRDECMKLTYDNVKPNFWNQTRHVWFFKKSKKILQKLSERKGLLMKIILNRRSQPLCPMSDNQFVPVHPAHIPAHNKV